MVFAFPLVLRPLTASKCKQCSIWLKAYQALARSSTNGLSSSAGMGKRERLGVQCGAKEVPGMPWIHTVPEDEADGLLRREYDAALKRAGKIFHIVSIQSLRPRVLRASIALYQALMIEEGELPRWTRELLAVVVSRTNECHY
jgi:hypothetical protein